MTSFASLFFLKWRLENKESASNSRRGGDEGEGRGGAAGGGAGGAETRLNWRNVIGTKLIMLLTIKFNWISWGFFCFCFYNETGNNSTNSQILFSSCRTSFTRERRGSLFRSYDIRSIANNSWWHKVQSQQNFQNLKKKTTQTFMYYGF